jgi:hypothetical protein
MMKMETTIDLKHELEIGVERHSRQGSQSACATLPRYTSVECAEPFFL